MHAISAIAFSGGEVEKYVDKCYHMDTYRKVYTPVIDAINGPNLWPRVDKNLQFPPKKLRLPGRPKKSRNKEPGELVTKKTRDSGQKLTRARFGPLKCKNCGIRGLNVRKCPNMRQQRCSNSNNSDKQLN